MAPEPARLLFVNASRERGGAEVTLLTLLRHLDRTRFTPSVCSLTEGPFVDELRQTGIGVAVVRAGAFRQLRSGWAVVQSLADLMRREAIDVVHANGTGAHVYAGLAARRASVPSVFHLHDLLAWTGGLQGVLHLFARLVPADAVVVGTSFSAGVVGRAIRARRVVTIPYGLDADDRGIAFDSARDTPAALAGPLVLWCGRLQRWKGPDVFLRAAARVRQAVPDARFLVVGGSLFGLEPTFERSLHDLAAALGLSDAVRFTGHVDDVGPLFAAADVVVHSSITPEPFGLVILEAMLAGKAVVASACGGPLDIIEPEETGLLVPPGDPETLAAAITRLLGDAPLRRRLGAAGRSRALRRFSAATMTRQFEQLYRDLMETRSAS